MSVPIAYQTAMAVELYEPQQFITHYDWTYSYQGNISPVLHARFMSPEGEFDGYAKPFDWNDAEQATVVLNEISGWLLAKACGLPCPPKAFFIQLPVNSLPSYNGPQPLPQPDPNGYVICFATQAVANTAVRGIYPTELLVKEQSEWPLCDKTIAFDEAIANTDRHLFNLLRRSEGDFVLIDHGFLLRDANIPYPIHWDSGMLEAMTEESFENLLHKNTYPLFGRSSPAVCVNGLTQGTGFSDKIHQAAKSVLFEIAFWCSKLLPGTSARWLRFLTQRTRQDLMSTLLHQRFGLIPIHVPATV